jgi:hypothetical protein
VATAKVCSDIMMSWRSIFDLSSAPTAQLLLPLLRNTQRSVPLAVSRNDTSSLGPNGKVAFLPPCTHTANQLPHYRKHQMGLHGAEKWSHLREGDAGALCPFHVKLGLGHKPHLVRQVLGRCRATATPTARWQMSAPDDLVAARPTMRLHSPSGKKRLRKTRAVRPKLRSSL